jgi:hypothetical protein
MPERRAQPSPEPTTFSLTTAVEAVVEKTAKNGRKYQAIEYVDQNGELKNVPVWDKKLLTDLEKGQAVELTLERKGAYWNLTGLTRLDAAAAKPDTFVPPEPVLLATPTITPPTLREALSPHDRGMVSANALTNAVTVVTTFKDVLQPQSRPEIMDAIVGFYHSFLELHTNPDAPRRLSDT